MNAAYYAELSARTYATAEEIEAGIKPKGPVGLTNQLKESSSFIRLGARKLRDVAEMVAAEEKAAES